MPVYNLFQAPTLGMRSQAHALNTIGINVANVNTGGYKRTDTHFETLISKSIYQQSDIGGTKPKDYQRISEQGFINASSRDLDIAINGDGFFYVSPTFEVTDEIYFTRDGSFQVGTADGQTSTVTADDNSTITVSNGYLVDKNGYFVLGMAADPATGLFSASDTLQPLRIDEWSFINEFTSTTTANLGLNLPSTNEVVADHASVVLAANAGTNNDNLETFIIEVVDSNGAKQSAQLNFTKKQLNTTYDATLDRNVVTGSTWEVSATTARASSPQSDTLMLTGTVEAGDTYSATINGTTVSYTTTAADANLAAVRAGLVAAINANPTIAAVATASAGNNPGEITITANAVGVSLTTTASSTNIDRAQVETVTLAGTVEAGDRYTVTVDGTTVTYDVGGGEADISAIAAGLIANINADATVGALVSAAPGALPGQITLTGKTTGNSFTTTVATPITGATTDNGASTTTTTTALTGNTDNGVTVGTNTNYQTTAIQSFTFDADGTYDQAQGAKTFSLTFADGATATVAIDMDQMQQYGSDFLKFTYDHNGLIKASMTGVHFDDAGQVIGKFQDGTDRAIYKLPLAQFTNPDGLEMKNGMVFRETPNSGEATAVFGDESGRASFTPYAFEISNVDIATEFSRMIQVQNAYNSSATVFRTVDEMVTVARDLKA